MRNQLPSNDYSFETKFNIADTACGYSNSFTPEQFAEIRSKINQTASEFRQLLLQKFPDKKIGYSRQLNSFGYLTEDGWQAIPHNEIVGVICTALPHIADDNECSKSELLGEEVSDERI